MKRVLIFGMSVLLLQSCGNTAENRAETTEEVSHQEHHHHETTGAIELNEGEKWRVNDEMKPHVMSGEELVQSYIQDGGTDYVVLAEKLQEQNSKLIKSCTMEGKSHDELHKWLHPHLDLVKMLKEETDSAKAKKLVAELEDSYHHYHQYFN